MAFSWPALHRQFFIRACKAVSASRTCARVLAASRALWGNLGWAMRRLVAYSTWFVRGLCSANRTVWEGGTAGWDIHEYNFVETIQCSCFTVFAFHHRGIPAMVLLHTEHSVQEDLLVDEHFVGGSSPIDRCLWGKLYRQKWHPKVGKALHQTTTSLLWQRSGGTGHGTRKFSVFGRHHGME